VDRAGISSAGARGARGHLTDEDRVDIRSGCTANPDLGKPGYGGVAVGAAAGSGKPVDQRDDRRTRIAHGVEASRTARVCGRSRADARRDALADGPVLAARIAIISVADFYGTGIPIGQEVL